MCRCRWAMHNIYVLYELVRRAQYAYAYQLLQSSISMHNITTTRRVCILLYCGSMVSPPTTDGPFPVTSRYLSDSDHWNVARIPVQLARVVVCVLQQYYIILYRHTSRVSVPASTTKTRTVSTLEYFSSIPYYYYAYSCKYIYILFTMHITTTLVLLQYESQYTSQQLSYYAQLVLQYEYESVIIYPHTNYTECILSILYIYI